MTMQRRDLLRLLTAAAMSSILPRGLARTAVDDDLYDIGRFGNARVLHITDTHAQLQPVHLREPSVNLGVGSQSGRPPHLVGRAFLEYFNIAMDTPRAHAFTYLDFTDTAHRYGKLGGFAHLKTLIDRLRSDVGWGNSLLLDGGDLWQGSGLANAMHGVDMVDAANLLGIEAMTGHWEFTYGEDHLRANLKRFNGEFLAQNVFLTKDAAFDGKPAFDPASGRVFKPAVVKEIGGRRLGVIGQAFPYVPIAHPRRFVSDWTFGIHESELQQLVLDLREKDEVDAVLLLSHNGMDVDLKLASLVSGIDVILGGHTHDAVPRPVVVKNARGKTLVTSAGSAGKFVGVLDLDVGKGRINGVRYHLLPVYANLLPADPRMQALIEHMRGAHALKLSEPLAIAGDLLYRRGNFCNTMDQLICDALRESLDAEIAFSPGFRWGNTVLPGEAITMEDVLSATAITYPEIYVREMTGEQIKAVMEDVCDNLFNPDPFYQQGGDMVRVGGMDYACAPNKTIGRRISDLTLDSGKTLEADKLYKVAGWASMDPQSGKPAWDVFADYLRSQKVAQPKKSNRVALKGVTNNPGVLG